MILKFENKNNWFVELVEMNPLIYIYIASYHIEILSIFTPHPFLNIFQFSANDLKPNLKFDIAI